MASLPYMPVAPQIWGRAAAVTKSDTNPNVYSSLYIGGIGDVAVIPQGQDTAVTFSAVPAGTILPIAVSKVMSTNTTATLILGLGGA